MCDGNDKNFCAGRVWYNNWIANTPQENTVPTPKKILFK